jgi:hypothetical protein
MRTTGLASRYEVAILATALALYLRYLLRPLLENRTYLTVWLVVAFCTWYCGLGRVFRTFAGEVAICGC